MRRLVGIAVALVLSTTATIAQTPTAAAPLSEAEILRRDLNDALDQLAVARAQRGDCEATLAPFEAQARRADSDRRWAAAKVAMEQARPGFECDARTGVCTKKPDPPVKDEPKKKDGSQ